MAKDLFASGFQWMKQAYPGFKDEQIKPYTFNPAPFLADKNSAQQGLSPRNRSKSERQGGFQAAGSSFSPTPVSRRRPP